MDVTDPQLFASHFHGVYPAYMSPLFRKPKRIRTAFSPGQLLQLEHAFEKNHYVVGAERKDLARKLSLTETQVRTHHFAYSLLCVRFVFAIKELSLLISDIMQTITLLRERNNKLLQIIFNYH